MAAANRPNRTSSNSLIHWIRRVGLLAVLLTVACAPSAAPPAKPASAPAAQSPASVAAPAPPSTGGPGGPSTAPATPPSPIAVRVAYASPGAALAPLFIGYENGIFREQGLDVELFYLAGTRTDQGVISGDTPIGFGANVVTSRLGGAELVAVAGVVSRLPALLFARSGIATPQDLRGKTIVSTSAGSSNHTATLLTMRRYGLEAGQDYGMQTTAGVPEKFAMMLQGYADGTLLAPPDDLKGQEQGLVQIANVADLNIPIVYTAVGVTTTYARDHAEEVRRFLRGYVGAVALARRDFEAARGPMSKYSQTDDPAIIEHSYRYYRDIWGRPDFRVPSDAVASSLRVLDAPGADTAKPEDFIDNRFLDELERSGFLRQAAPFN